MGRENRAIPDCIEDDLHWLSNLCGRDLRCFSQEQTLEA